MDEQEYDLTVPANKEAPARAEKGRGVKE